MIGDLHYKSSNMPSFAPTKTLNIWYNDKNVFTLAEGDSGFDKEILDMIAEKLKELEDNT
jgi:hypothetical protein